MKADDLKTKKGKKKKKTHGLSKGELHRAIAEKSGLSKKRVAEVFDALEHVLAEQLNSDGPGEFTLPGLVKFKRRRARKRSFFFIRKFQDFMDNN